MSETTESTNVPHEKRVAETQNREHAGETHVVKVAHADGFIDYVDAHAVGGDFRAMPKGYYYSFQFIMTFVVSFGLHLCFQGPTYI
jgi:hypothetical protein